MVPNLKELRMYVAGHSIVISGHARDRVEEKLHWSHGDFMNRCGRVACRWAIGRDAGEYHVTDQGATWVFRCKPMEDETIILTVLGHGDKPLGIANPIDTRFFSEGLGAQVDNMDFCECGRRKAQFRHLCPAGGRRRDSLRFGCEVCENLCDLCDGHCSE